MQTHHTISETRQTIQQVLAQGKTVGLVPTMGFLHEGHMSLVDRARRDNDFVVVSVFVNPLQFGPNEDFEAYPRDLDRDAQLLITHGCDLLFAPSPAEMYPRPSETTVELPNLAKTLCGVSRPGHFRGVATVVSKLLHIVTPTRVYFGQKDGQQVAIIKRMVADLNLPVEVVTCPIIREPDGLAKSSRNIYLTNADRDHALALYHTLTAARTAIETGTRDGRTIAALMQRQLEESPGVRLDYAEVVDLDTLQPIEGEITGDIMLAIAAYVGAKARLIDNFQLHVAGDSVSDLNRA
jgi:pantoate--beta-alanine ligase